MARWRRVLYNEHMRVNIRQKDIEGADSMREYIERKIVHPVQKRLKRLALSDMPILDIEISRITHHHHKGLVYAATATLVMGKKSIRAEATDMDMHAACDVLADELTREIVGYKTRQRSVFLRGARKAKQYISINPAAWFRRGSSERDEGS